MRLPNLTIGNVDKAAKMLAQESALSLSQCRETISKAIGFKDYFDLKRNGVSKTGQSSFADSHSMEVEITTTVLVSHHLKVSPVTAHHVLSNTLFYRGPTPNMEQALKVISGVFERTVLPQQGWRQPGQIGILKSPGRNGEHVILREFGQPTRIITHNSINAIVADYEYIGPRKSLPLFIPMRLYIPYGIWTEHDGSRVLFSRDYFPMWRLREGQTPERMNPWEWIKFVEQTWILPEGEMPWDKPDNFDGCVHFLEREGIRSFPLLLDALPMIVKDSFVGEYSNVAKELEALTR
ncbi:hypothetical protein [Aquicoccus porphyridii]|uniref:hypothetical protein n=1 Tax=Aquicoccus porphyridii TaxID=1852029 RepID=UPI00273E278E|nr:hypothetical protein [Aquicoccus porphyridii]